MPALMSSSGASGKGEEERRSRQRCAGESFGVAVFSCEFDGDFGGHGAGHLAGAGAQELAGFGDRDGGGFDVLGAQPDEGEVEPISFGGAAEGGDGAGVAVEAGGV